MTTPIRLLVLLGLLAFGRSHGSLRKGVHVAQKPTAISETRQRELEIEEYPIELEPFHIVYHHHPRRDQTFEEMEEMDVLVATRNYLVQRLSQEQPDYFLRLLLYLFIREDDEYMTKVAYSGTAFYSKQYMRNISNTIMRQQVQDTAWLAFLGGNKTDYLSELTRNNVFDIDSITLLNAGGHIVGVDRVSGELLTITSAPATEPPILSNSSSSSSSSNAPPNTDMSSTVSMTIYLCSIIIPLVVFAMVITWWVARKLRFDVVWTRPRELDPEHQIWHTSRRLERRFYKPKSGSQSRSETSGSAASTRKGGNINHDNDKATKYSLIPVHIVSVQDATSTSTTTLSKKEKKMRIPKQDLSEDEPESTMCEENGLRIDQKKPKAKAKQNSQRRASKGTPSANTTTSGEIIKNKKRINQSSQADTAVPIKPLRKQNSANKASLIAVQESKNDSKSTTKADKESLDGSKSKSKTNNGSVKGNKGKGKGPSGRKLHEKSNVPSSADACILEPSRQKAIQSEGLTSSHIVKTMKRTSKKESKSESSPSKKMDEPKPPSKKEPKAEGDETEPCAKPKKKSSRKKQSTLKANQMETS